MSLKKPSACVLVFLFICTSILAQDRYWVHKPFYENTFSTASELSEWSLVEDNGTGGFTLSGTGSAILKMDDAAGSYANRIFSMNGSGPRFLPLDSIYGRLEINIVRTTGGTQRFFVQAQTFNSSNTYINQINVLAATTGNGFFSINMRGLGWPANADKVRFIIGGANFSGQQGTVEFDYINYSNSNGLWDNSSNWSATSGGAGGASLPDLNSIAIFDGAASSNGSCQLNTTVSVKGIQIGSGFSGNIDLQNNSLTAGSSGFIMSGGGISGNTGTLIVNGDLSVTAGIFKGSSDFSTVTGNINITGGNINLSQGTLWFNSAGNQTFALPAATPVRNLILNKAGNITLGSNIQILDTLDLRNGTINTGAYSVQLGTSSADRAALSSTGGLINGTFSKWLAVISSVTVPFGSSSYYAPLTVGVTTTPTSGGLLTMTYRDFGNASTSVNFNDGASIITGRRQSVWEINPGTITGGNYNLSASSNSLGYSGAVSNLHLVLASGVIGTHVPASGTAGNPVLSRSALTVNGLANSFYAGIASATLPVNWLNFSARNIDNKYVLLTWKVEEYDVSSYEIQKTTDGKEFIPIGKINPKGKGAQDYQFNDINISPKALYRIKSVDLDGKQAYSAQAEVISASNFSWFLATSKSNGLITVKLTEFNGTTSIILSDLQGRIIFRGGIRSLETTLAAAKNTVYNVTLYHNGKAYTKRVSVP